MIGQQCRKESLFYYFRLEDQVPETHLLRLIDRYIDFSFVRDRLRNFYSQTSRPHGVRQRSRCRMGGSSCVWRRPCCLRPTTIAGSACSGLSFMYSGTRSAALASLL